jgi:hypothetical protein
LPIAASLTDIMGGTLHIDSIVDEGTTVTLPVDASGTIIKAAQNQASAVA